MQDDSELLAQLGELTGSSRRRSLLSFLVDGFSRSLGSDPAAFDPAARFVDLSTDSLKAVELKQWLEKSLGLRLRSTLLLDHATLHQLCDHLLEQLDRRGERQGGSKGQVGTDAPRPAIVAPAPADDIAVVGYACRLPGRCDSAAEYWELLRTGRDAIERLEPAVLAQRGALTRGSSGLPAYAGLITDVAGFDARLFGISPREAVEMDPQQRVLLQVCWEALENAAVEIRREKPRDVAVYVGTRGSEYHDARRLQGDAAFQGTGASVAALSGRIAHCFGFTGPAVTIDTACSASLVALHYAAEDLRRGVASFALVAGVNLLLSPFGMRATHAARMLAPDGRCKAFSARANGYVRSEGCVVLVLQRSSDAQAQGREVLGTIKGSSVNQDGTTSGLTVPSGRAQRDVISLALRRAQLSPGAVDYVECHGTGTELGDPIELQALSEALGAPARSRPVPIGSVKSQIGHTEPTAGLASVLKVLLGMRHGVMPRTLHCEGGLNTHVDWPELGLEPVRENTSWPERNGARIAGVSSFGFTGTNAHVVLASAPPVAPAAGVTEPTWFLLTLSAATPAALEASRLRFARWLAGRSARDVEAACRASNLTRSTLAFRRAFQGANATELLAELERSSAPAVRHPNRPSVVLVLAGSDEDFAAFQATFGGPWPAFERALALRLLAIARASGVADERQLIGSRRDLFALGVACALGDALQELGCEVDAWGGSDAGLAAAHILAGASLESVLARLGGGGSFEGLGRKGVVPLHQLASLRAADQSSATVVVGALDPPLPDALTLSPALHSLITLVARLFEHGAQLDFAGLSPATAGRYLELPNYPFEAHPFWPQSEPEPLADEASPCRELKSPLLPESARAFVVELGVGTGPWLADHRVEDLAIFPAAGVLDVLRGLGVELWKTEQVTVRDLRLERAILLGPRFTLHVTLRPVGDGFDAELSSEAPSGSGFVRHAQARLVRLAADVTVDEANRVDVAAGNAEELAGDGVYAMLRAAGIDHGPRFRALQEVRVAAHSARAEVDVAAGPTAAWGTVGLDACFLASVPLLRQREDAFVRLPAGCDEAQFFRELPATFSAAVRLRGSVTDAELKVDLDVFDAAGPLASVRGLRLAARARAALPASSGALGVDWLERTLPLAAAPDLPTSFELVTDDASFGARLAAVLRAVHGATAVWRAPGQTLPSDSPGSRQPRQVVWLNRSGSGADFLRSLTLELPELLATPRGSRLWCVTREVHGGGPEAARYDVVSRNLLAGLVRTLQHEQPRLDAALIDLGEGLSAETECELLAAEFRRNVNDAEVRYADGLRQVRRLSVVSVLQPTPALPALRPDASYLVTGGAGGLGRLAVERLSDAGAGHVIVASRAPSQLDDLKGRLSSRGTKLTVWEVDVSDRAALAAKLQSIDAGEPLRGVVHAAGVVRDHVLERMTTEELEQVLAPKLAGTWNLHELTLALPLDFFVVYSSLAGVLGSPGQGSYAAANSFQDGLIAARNRAGLPGVSLAWGPWGEVGMAHGPGGGAERLERLGVRPLRNQEALSFFNAAIARGRGLAIVATVDWPAYARNVDVRLRDVLPLDAAVNTNLAGEVGAELRRLVATDGAQASRRLDDYLQERLAEVSGGRAISEHDSFFELGLDSLQAVSLRNRIERDLGIELSASLIFDYPTLADLRRHLCVEHFGLQQALPAPVLAPELLLGGNDPSWASPWDAGPGAPVPDADMAAFMASLQSLEQELES